MNKDIWNKLSKPPASALKEIGGGRLKGMTDVNPQWRYEAMTEVFGVCGVGWKYTIDKTWRENGYGDEVFAFAQVSIYVNRKESGGIWSDAIQGQGGSRLVTQEKNGIHCSDEGYKMAITDALGTAMKMLGVAAEIYAGRWDGSKYLAVPEQPSIKLPPLDAKQAEQEYNKWIGEKLNLLDDDGTENIELSNATWFAKASNIRTGITKWIAKLKSDEVKKNDELLDKIALAKAAVNGGRIVNLDAEDVL